MEDLHLARAGLPQCPKTHRFWDIALKAKRAARLLLIESQRRSLYAPPHISLPGSSVSGNAGKRKKIAFNGVQSRKFGGILCSIHRKFIATRYLLGARRARREASLRIEDLARYELRPEAM
jgi:hypothetical protein